MNYLPDYLNEAGDLAKPDPVETGKYTPDPLHVMSRDTHGNIVSLYKDETWDFTMFLGKGTRFHIEEFIREISTMENINKYRNEFKLILFRIIYNSRSNSLNTVSQLFYILKRQTKFASKRGTSIKRSLMDTAILNFIIFDENLSKIQIGRRLLDTKILFSTLHLISTIIDDFEFIPSKNALEHLKKLMKEYPTKVNQTPVIPTRILSSRIKSCFEYIESFIRFKNQFDKLFKFRSKRRIINDKNGRNDRKSREILSKDFKIELSKIEYCEFVAFFHITDYIALRGLIGKVRLAIIEMIHAFTGMRIGETASIAMDGYQIKMIGRQEIPVVRSYTTKMAKDHGYFAEWVTSPEIEIAFEAAKIINYALLFHDYGIKPKEINESLIPLFLSSDHKEKINRKGSLYEYPTQRIKLSGWKDHPINKDQEIIVREEDLSEILAIDSFLDIDSLKPGIEIGKPFSFQTHMYRRSLAVYTARSGLVSLPALKIQLKHIRIQTSAYYGKNAAFAKNFILPKVDEKIIDDTIISQRGFINEFQDELSEDQADLLYTEVVTTDEVIFGGIGSQIHKQKKSGTLPTIFTNRKDTVARIKQGRLRYAETPLGGCMATELCDRIAFSSITTCIRCPSSVFNNKTVKILEKTKKDYERRLSLFGVDTPYGKQLEIDIKDIDSLLKIREKLASIPIKEIE